MVLMDSEEYYEKIRNRTIKQVEDGVFGTFDGIAEMLRYSFQEALREKLEKRISELINLNFGFIMELVANYFNPPFIEYGKEVGTWITVNPLYEESRVYGRYCHNCGHPTCNDIERVIPGTRQEEAMQ